MVSNAVIMQDAQAFNFDGDYGEIYEDLAHKVIPGYDTLFPATLALMMERIGMYAHVLVVGCGTGREISVFAPHAPGWRITAVDPAIEMVRFTEEVAARLGVQVQTDVRHGYVHELSASAQFDGATVINVMHFLRDDGAKDQLMQSVAARIRPGGTVALFDLHGDRKAPYFSLFYEAWKRYMTLRGYEDMAKESLLERLAAGIAYVSEARIMEICAHAGLQLVRKYWSGLLYGGWLLERARAA